MRGKSDSEVTLTNNAHFRWLNTMISVQLISSPGGHEFPSGKSSRRLTPAVFGI